MTHVDLDDMRALLAAEKDQLEEELGTRGKKTAGNDWQGSSGDIKTSTADFTEIADQIEELATNIPLVEELESRYREVNEALERIEKNEFGKCAVCDIEIPKDRLEANPAAKTCIEHTE
jgi:DnaK suppressor protein